MSFLWAYRKFLPFVVLSKCYMNGFSKSLYKTNNKISIPINLLKCKSNIGNSFIAYSFSVYGLFKSADDKIPEDKLVQIIKQSILCIHREQYDKAEQMLHLALRMAQDLQSKDGITYVYDIMANLAMERGQFKKAEILFADVMRRLLSNGVAEDNIKMLHISSKLAHIAQLKGDMNKSRIGFVWTLSILEDCKRKMPDDIDLKELWGLTTNWFGQLLMKENNFEQAKQCFKSAYDCFQQIHGIEHEEAVTLLNNLSVACSNMEQFDEARRYLLMALDIVKKLNDTSQEGILLANLGLVYLREGFITEAKNSCSKAWKSAKAQQNVTAVEQAEFCLHEIKMHLRE